MSLFSPSTNRLYRGSLASIWLLGLYGLLELGTGCSFPCFLGLGSSNGSSCRWPPG